MTVINFLKGEISAKIVYYGPGLSGKTTNVKKIYDSLPRENTGELVTLSTETDRTLFFDFIPVKIGDVAGFKVKFQLFTVPGQVIYNATRRIVLQNVDGIVFVADSQVSMMEENKESLRNLKENLSFYGRFLKDIPLVYQYNKRDLKDIVPLETMNRELNPSNLPAYPAVAIEAKGVNETLARIFGLVLLDMKRNLKEKGRAGEKEGISIDSTASTPSDEEMVKSLLGQIAEVRPLESVFDRPAGGERVVGEGGGEEKVIPFPPPGEERGPAPSVKGEKERAGTGEEEGEEPPFTATRIPLPYRYSIEAIKSVRRVGNRGLSISLLIRGREKKVKIPARIDISFEEGDDGEDYPLERGISIGGLGRIPLYGVLIIIWMIILTVILLAG